MKSTCLTVTSLFLGLSLIVSAQEQQTVSFQDGVNGYGGTRDTWMDAAAPGTNFGSDNELNVDGGGGTSNESTLILWDLISIPFGSTINSVDITLNVTNTSTDSYKFYEMKRPWVESEVNYVDYASGSSWQVPGADGTEDRGSTVLGSITPLSGIITTSLNAAGIAMVQTWVDNPSNNHGFIIMDYSVTGGADFSSREETANHPKMTVVYTQPPGLMVTSPNGGEIWEVGSVHDINWNSADPGGTVKLEYSTDNGLNWSDIFASTEDDGTEPWTVPATPTYQALIRISDTDVSGPSDISDAVFTIASGPILIVTSPNGGEDWECGSIQNINWNSLGTSGMVKIEYSTDTGFNWNDITTTDDDGTEPWLVPQTPTSQALVRVSDTNVSGPSDVSDAVFTLTSPPQEEAIIFSATGDIPQGSGDYAILQQQIVDHNLYSPSEFLVHVGDIKEQTTICPESYYSLAANILKELAVPVFIVPGDNGTSDCSNEAEAWAFWVQYFMDFELNFCGAPFAERQTARLENLAFVSKGVLFIGIHLTSSSDPIMADDADWIEQQFTDKVSQVRGAVVFTHRGPSSSLSPFFDRFVAAAQTFAKPILFLHGHGHSWIEDHYWSSAPNVLRIQVDNGGAEEPVQITVTMDDQDPAHMFTYIRNPLNPPLYNVRPCVEAGSDQQLDFGSAADLEGRATDDGVPTLPGTTTTTWLKISGPGTVTFNNPNNVNTSASFSKAGSYVLRLTADDGELQNYDELTVDVKGSLVEARIFLEGSYSVSGDTMKTDLRDNNLVLSTSPYAEDRRTISAPIPLDVTDWVLVELRETANDTAVASKSAFIRNDGRIVADDGVTPLVMMDAGTGPYFIVIKHRNHLSVMSAASVQLNTSSSTLYDFTIGAAQFYGSDAKQLETDVFGMYKGDANGNSFVNSADYLKVKGEIGSNGYYNGDCNLNGFVNSADYLNVKTNVGKASQVP